MKGTTITNPLPLDAEQLATRLDRAGEACIRAAALVVFRQASTDYERECSYRLRFQAVVDQGWAYPAEFPEGQEREPADEWPTATHIVAWLGDEAVASCRLIFPDSTRLLPIEEYFSLRIEPLGQVVQVDRICVGKLVSVRSMTLFMGLTGAAWQDVRDKGYCVWAGIISRPMWRRLRLMGFDYEILGPAKRWWNEDRYPVRSSPLHVSERYFANVEKLVARNSVGQS